MASTATRGVCWSWRFSFLLRDQWVSFLRSIGALHNLDARPIGPARRRNGHLFPEPCVIYYLPSGPAALGVDCSRSVVYASRPREADQLNFHRRVHQTASCPPSAWNCGRLMRMGINEVRIEPQKRRMETGGAIKSVGQSTLAALPRRPLLPFQFPGLSGAGAFNLSLVREEKLGGADSSALPNPLMRQPWITTLAETIPVILLGSGAFGNAPYRSHHWDTNRAERLSCFQLRKGDSSA